MSEQNQNKPKSKIIKKKNNQPRVKTKTIVKKILVSPKNVPPKNEDSVAKYLSITIKNLQSVLTVPTIIYIVTIFAIYTDTVNHPDDNNLKNILTYLSKFSLISGIVNFFAKHPTKLFAILVYGVILVDKRTNKHYYWFFSLSILSLLTTDAPILLYLLQSISILLYMSSTKQRSLFTTAMCLIPLMYYAFSVQPTFASLNDPKDPYDNYTLPPIVLNTTQSPILSRNVLNTAV